jgi:hypothetical protein
MTNTLYDQYQPAWATMFQDFILIDVVIGNEIAASSGVSRNF